MIGKSLTLGLLLAVSNVFAADITILNVSYDPTRELYQAINPLFAQEWQKKTGKTVEIQQSHGGGGKQARSVIDGLQADVVTLAIPYDVDQIAKNGLLAEDWQKHFTHESAPFHSTIVFVVRKGNPKNINDWGDLTRNDVKVITPNPKTSGGARLNHLAAWGFAIQKYQSEDKAKDFLRKLYKNVPVLDSGARGASMSFAERNLGDVLLTWENEAHLLLKEHTGKVEIVTPPTSILAQPPVAVVDKVAQKRGTTDVAQGYLTFLYSPAAQRLAAQHYYRPTDKAISQEFSQQFPKIEFLPFEKLFGNWQQAHQKHFKDGGIFDEVYQ